MPLGPSIFFLPSYCPLKCPHFLVLLEPLDQQTRGQPNIHFPYPAFRLQEKITEPCGLSQCEIVVSLVNGDLTGDQQSFPGHLYSTSIPKHHSNLILHCQTQHFEQITSPPTLLSNVTLPGQSSFNVLPLLPA